MSNPEWYAAKTVYKQHLAENGIPKTVFEERIVLFRAVSFDDAIPQAEAEALNYCDTDEGREYLGFVDIFHLLGETIVDGTEIYSLMRESKLSDKDYLDHFYDDGKERRQKG